MENIRAFFTRSLAEAANELAEKDAPIAQISQTSSEVFGKTH